MPSLSLRLRHLFWYYLGLSYLRTCEHSERQTTELSGNPSISKLIKLRVVTFSANWIYPLQVYTLCDGIAGAFDLALSLSLSLHLSLRVWARSLACGCCCSYRCCCSRCFCCCCCFDPFAFTFYVSVSPSQWGCVCVCEGRINDIKYIWNLKCTKEPKINRGHKTNT